VLLPGHSSHARMLSPASSCSLTRLGLAPIQGVDASAHLGARMDAGGGTSEKVPSGQSEHICVPLPFLYVPAAQGVQGPPAGPVKPGSHRHSERFVAPAGEVAFSGHAAQSMNTDGTRPSGGTAVELLRKYSPASQPYTHCAAARRTSATVNKVLGVSGLHCSKGHETQGLPWEA